MNKQEKSALLQTGRTRCLEPLERLFQEALQESNFKRAENWYQEYCGAAKMLECLGMISRKKYRSMTESLLHRLLDAEYSGSQEKEESV